MPLPAARVRDGDPPRRESTTYTALINVATQLFGELGYERTTVREIAKRMGLQSGSLYSHVASKDEVLEEIVRRVGDEFMTRAEAAVSRSDDPEEVLRELLAQHLQVMHDYPQAVTVYFDEWTKLGEDSRRWIAEVRRDYERILEDVIRAGIAQGKFRGVDVRSAVLLIDSALNWTYKWYSPRGRYSPRELADRYADLLISGLHR